MRSHARKATSLLLAAVLAIPILFLAVGALAAPPVPPGADPPPFDDAARLEMAMRHAPVLQYVKGESCYPVEVDYYLESCSLYQVVDDQPVLVTEDPTIPQLAQIRTDDYFLDNRLGGVSDNGIIDAYQQNMTQLGYTVYYHVTAQDGLTYIQYWMFYVFNPGELNRHQGDWEMVQVVLDAAQEPVGTTYSQHNDAVSAQWPDVIVRNGSHPVVYVALGSHANYYRYYQGKLQGLDTCGDDGAALSQGDYQLVEIRDWALNSYPDTSWVWFAGRWGTIPDMTAHIRGEAGPQGPMYREDGWMWNGPEFYAEARELSTDTLWLEMILYYFNWIVLALFALAVALTAWRAYKMRKKGELKAPYIELINIRDGSRRSLANAIALAGLFVAVIGLMYPVFTMEINVPEGQYATGGFTTLFSLGGKNLFVLNTLAPEGQVINVGAVAVNFSLILALMVVLFVINSTAAGPKRASKKYRRFGITLLLLFLVFMTAVVLMGYVVEAVAPPEAAGLVELLKYVSQNPWGGSGSVDVQDYGVVELRWGLDLGALLLLAGIALIVAGLMMRSVWKAEARAEKNKAP